MKKVFALFFIVLTAGIINNTNAQSCTPDHPGYTTVPNSGIMIPSVMPNAQVGIYYEQPITIGIPDSASGYPLNWVQYVSYTNVITADIWTIVNNTGGSTFSKWNKLTWQCVTIKGTPTTAGTDSLRLFVNANVSLYGIPYTQNNVKAYTVPLVIDAATDIQDYSNVSTKLIESYPNPFQDKTRIGVLTGKTEKATLNIYSSLGQLVFSEVKTIFLGENYFNFNGASLTNGTYVYTVITDEKIFNKKLIKVE